MRTLRLVLALACLLAESSLAATVRVCVTTAGRLALVARDVPATQTPAEVALNALAAGPSAAEQAQGLGSAIPAGTSIVQFLVEPDLVTVDFSPDLITSDFGDAFLEAVYEQVYWTLW